MTTPPRRKLVSSSLLLPCVLARPTENFTCGVWFAASTIKGAGLGIFAGRNFTQGEQLLPVGDLVIPLVDIYLNHPQKWNFLWSEYTWAGHSLFMDHEGVHDEMSVASPGFGAAVNCFMDLVNVKETVPDNTVAGLHRSRDPGAGGFTAYWNRQTKATTNITEGNELFASYGNGWFTSREDYIGPVPIKGDLKKADILLEVFAHLEQNLLTYHGLANTFPQISLHLFENFIWQNPWNDTSRILFALNHHDWKEIRYAMETSVDSLMRQKHSVTLEHLERYGVCGDTITVRNSTLRQAGRGAFSRTTFEPGQVVAPFPLIHIPDRMRMDMYRLNKDSGAYAPDTTNKTHTQLLLNYCLGHEESTLLLCPYGTLSSHINHNQTLANVKLVWADPERSNHHPDWLNKSLGELDQISYAGLAMELVATRSIYPGDEVFLDYGDQWEEAWQQHLKLWIPGNADYKSAEYFNEKAKYIKTEFETLFEPYPGNVVVKVSLAFWASRSKWISHWENGTLVDFMDVADEYYCDCDVLRRRRDENGNIWYAVLLVDHTGISAPGKTLKKLVDIPREAFRFFDRAYTTDMHQQNAFRHAIGIPDHLFPDQWRTLKHDGKPDNESSRDL